jgi:hypothetical protein
MSHGSMNGSVCCKMVIEQNRLGLCSVKDAIGLKAATYAFNLIVSKVELAILEINWRK